jgi:hypothetical protein
LCRRLFLTSALLGVPPSDAGRSADQGLFVHELLRFVHDTGSCRDRTHVETVLADHGADDEYYRGVVERHAQRCPASWEAAVHERELARFHREPVPMFMATARIDAMWLHDGLLDARDYKTGARWYERVADDPRAHVQAYVLAKVAARRGLRLRLRYEHLAAEVDDDPEPWEPDNDDLEAVEESLRAAVQAMWEERDWKGAADAPACRACRYRSICPDTAAPGLPAWPSLATASGPEQPGK